MTKLAKDAIKSCLSCQITFDRTHDELLRPTPLPPHVWHTISIDFKGPLKDRKYILVAYDLYSRYPIGHQFYEYAEKKGFYHRRITPRHPQANGECERFMQNLNKAIRIAKKENTDYKGKINGMLEAYRATPHLSTSKSPYELMFGRKMNLNIFPTMKRRVKDEVIRNRDKRHKEKAKIYYDRKKNVKKSHIRVGDRVLMKDKRTDRLRPEVGVVIELTEYSATVLFGNGRIYKRDKSHIKVVNKAVIPPTKKSDSVKQPKRYELYDSNESDVEETNREQITLSTRSGRQIKKPERFGEWTV
ncbi:uncharacterized protein K02A2.6-like [Dendronephthya gigantea]|uniref:uncharacterized protein K02A2.6-like n=1 Tax=Dendronephthya gigantea TaxID=151771 RepID=UPI0010691700|nr:uncharacterized protein K02A2.6-like [Dendronephthya gigantea]